MTGLYRRITRLHKRFFTNCSKLCIISTLCSVIIMYGTLMFVIGSGDNEGGVCFAVDQSNRLKPHHYVTLSVWSGNLGNHMFQYASLIGVAGRQGYMTYVTSDSPLLKSFDVPNITSACSKPTNVETLQPKRCCAYDDITTCLEYKSNNYTLHGFFQSWRYFQYMSKTIRKVFTIKDKFISRAKQFISDASKSRRPNVCVHIRRGDQRKIRELLRGYSQPGLNYVHKAMNYMRDATKNPQFIVLSDDMTWCKDRINGNDIIFSPFANEAGILDLALMSQCDHVIFTTGTFGWWGGGAWLAGGTTVYYRGYPRPGSWLATQTDMHDYYPPDWIALE